MPLRAAAGLFFCCVLVTTGSQGQSPSSEISLDASLRPYLARFELPALAAAVVRKGEVLASGAVGTRRAGTVSPVTLEDRFHIGSDTKAMTSLIAATLVESGKIAWSTSVGEVFSGTRTVHD
jgi:CubicO group peptidase (beta-lactamase class C family)